MQIDDGQWEAHSKAMAESGLSRAEYCRKHGVDYGRLFRWQQRQAKTRSKPKARAFVRARPAPTSQPKSVDGARGARLVTPSGAALEFHPSADPRWIGRVLAELGGAK